MLTLKTFRQLRSKRNLKSFRACPASTGLTSWRAEMRRLSLNDVVLANNELRRVLLAEPWNAHLRRCRLIRAL